MKQKMATISRIICCIFFFSPSFKKGNIHLRGIYEVFQLKRGCVKERGIYLKYHSIYEHLELKAHIVVCVCVCVCVFVCVCVCVCVFFIFLRIS